MAYMWSYEARDDEHSSGTISIAGNGRRKVYLENVKDHNLVYIFTNTLIEVEQETSLYKGNVTRKEINLICRQTPSIIHVPSYPKNPPPGSLFV